MNTTKIIKRWTFALLIMLLPMTAMSQKEYPEDVPYGFGVLHGIAIQPEERCSEYDSSHYSYPQSLEQDLYERYNNTYYTPYTGRVFESKDDTDIEHMLAKAEAHDSGMCSRTREEKKAFARDLNNLTLAGKTVNRNRKSSKDFSGWLPPLNVCWYVQRVVNTKRRYRLSMDQAEADVAYEVLNGCGGNRMKFFAHEDSIDSATGTNIQFISMESVGNETTSDK